MSVFFYLSLKLKLFKYTLNYQTSYKKENVIWIWTFHIESKQTKRKKYNMIRVSLWLCSNGNGVTFSLFFHERNKKWYFCFEKKVTILQIRSHLFVTKLFLSLSLSHFFFVIHFILYRCHHCCFEPPQVLNHLVMPQK